MNEIKRKRGRPRGQNYKRVMTYLPPTQIAKLKRMAEITKWNHSAQIRRALQILWMHEPFKGAEARHERATKRSEAFGGEL